MHRLLLCYRSTSLIIYSLNKNRSIQTISFGALDKDKGFALSCDFLSNTGEAFAVGYSSGLIGLYKSESTSQKPYQVIDIKVREIESMCLTVMNH